MYVRFILLLGLTSLFADWLYESMRAVVPQYLAMLGASAVFVGFVFGLGDAIGYAARLATGPLADRRGGYWLETFFGYGLQVGAVVGLIFARDIWQVALLVFLERFAKALRTPSRDVLIASAGGKSSGKAYGLHAAIDQVGGIIGAFMATAVLYLGRSPVDVFVMAIPPGLVALAILFVAYRLGGVSPPRRTSDRGRVAFFGLSQFFLGLSLIHISLFMYKLAEVPWAAAMLYLAAMIFEIPASLLLGYMYDRNVKTVALGPLSAVFLALSFVQGLFFLGAFIYAALISYADVTAKAQASKLGGATSLGVINAMWGFGLLAGGVIYGYLVEIDAVWLIVFTSLATSATSMALLWRTIS
ncbi:MAG: MFS transporter [Pyrobaculum sp.]